jgi:UDPglucose--hexose-1-phosphate uridylyltransferase
MFDRVSSRGASEIVIEHPDHRAAWDTMPLPELERVLWMYRDRVADLHRDRQIRSLLVLRNEPTPTSRISHPFSRIIGAPIIFDCLRQELVTARQHFAYKQRCLYCDIIHQEIREGLRVVTQTPYFLVYSPYGSHRPFETWIIPLTHRHRFHDIAHPEVGDLAAAIQTTFRRLHAVRPGSPLDFSLHTAPNEVMRLRDDEWRTLSEDFHWHIEIAPNGQTHDTLGGFAVNPVPPELAAKLLRQAT